jgi:predicted HTH transcriptional regulator
MKKEMQLIESETLELKKSTSELKAGIVSLAAMLNKHQRGELWFGIKNDGTAVGQTISDIREKMVSMRRNELLAELFQRRHLIEKWGRGIKMILAKEPATEFEEVGTMLFVARFRRKGLQKGVIGNTDVTSEEGSGKSSGKSSGKTKNQLLVYLSARPGRTIPPCRSGQGWALGSN